MSGQVSADQVEVFFDNLKAAVLDALWRHQDVTIQAKHLFAPSFSAYDTESAWTGSRFIIDLPRPRQPGQVEVPLMVKPEVDHG